MKKMLLIIAALLFSLIVVCSSTGYAKEDPKEVEKEILVGVEYFCGWWPDSPSKWETGGKDWRQEYPDRVPLLGEYNSQETMDKEIVVAADHGVDFFSILWYYPGPNPTLQRLEECRKLNAGLEFFMNSPHSGRMKFMLELTNHPPFHVRSEQDWDAFADLCIKAMKHPSYLRIDGRSVVKIHGGEHFFRDMNSDKERCRKVLQRMRKAVKEAGIGELLITAGTYGNVSIQPPHYFVTIGEIDGTMEYMEGPALPKREEPYPFLELVAGATTLRKTHSKDALPWTPFFPMGWNPKPWKVPGNAYTLPTEEELRTSLIELKKDLRDSSCFGFPRKDGSLQKAFTIYAWNEFGEGGFLAPTKGTGDMKLRILKEVFGND